jgi:broad specificity phosphatase PhoE
MATKVRVLIRHAQSLSNRGEPTAGPVDLIPLSAEGEKTAIEFAVSMAVVGAPDLLVCSRNLRSQQTCAILQKHRFTDTPTETWNIHEFHFLDFGLQATTPAQRRPLVEQYFGDCDPQRKNPGAESWSEFYFRCKALDEKLAGHSARSIVLVGHGYLISAVLTLRALDFPPVSSSLMRLVHEKHKASPIENLQSFRLEYLA